MQRNLLISALVAGAIAHGAQAVEHMDATAIMFDAEGNSLGMVSFREGENGVLITAELEGLPPGWHSFHLHETGSCLPDFSAAGGHFAPLGNEHGLLNAAGPHAGDMPNLHVAEDGRGMAEYFTDRVTLVPGAQTNLLDADGGAVVIHANPDSYGAEAGSGGRLACGVIELSG